MIFVDETAKDERTFTRLYDYFPVNTRAKKSVVFIKRKHYTILPALFLEDFIVIDIMEGSCDKEKFQTFVLTQLVIKLYILFYCCYYNYLKIYKINNLIKKNYLKIFFY